jgi:hypothetical protein
VFKNLVESAMMCVDLVEPQERSVWVIGVRHEGRQHSVDEERIYLCFYWLCVSVAHVYIYIERERDRERQIKPYLIFHNTQHTHHHYISHTHTSFIHTVASRSIYL